MTANVSTIFFFESSKKKLKRKEKKIIYDRAWCWNMFKQEKSCQKWNDNTMPNIDDRANMQLASYIAPRSRSCIHATQFNGCKWCFSKQQQTSTRFFDREISFFLAVIVFPLYKKTPQLFLCRPPDPEFWISLTPHYSNQLIYISQKFWKVFQNHSSSFLNFENSRKRCTKKSL